MLTFLGSQVKDGVSVVQWCKMRDLADYVQLSLRKDRNASQGIDFIMQDDSISIQAQPRNPFAKREYKDDMEALLEFVRSKIADYHKNMRLAFMFFDTKGKGKLRKLDFQHGLEKMRILLSKHDVTKVFEYLDTEKAGFIYFNQFCAIEATSDKEVDGYRLASIKEQIQDRIQKEELAEKAIKQQE